MRGQDSDRRLLKIMAKKEKVEFIEEEVELAPPAPNVVFAGREWRTDEETGKQKLLPSRFAPEKVNTATGAIHLPPSDVQTGGAFYSEHADFLIKSFPAPKGRVAGVFYKQPKGKGE
jgi:hypothetical protein